MSASRAGCVLLRRARLGLVSSGCSGRQLTVAVGWPQAGLHSGVKARDHSRFLRINATGHRGVASEAAEGDSPPTEDELRARIAEMKEMIDELGEKTKQNKQEGQQAQKRHFVDMENETKYGVTKFAKEMLKIADNLERAADSVKKEDLDQHRELRKMHASVNRMRSVVKEALEEFGVVRMEAMDATFDPEMHEAMFVMDMPGKDPNTVFHVMEPGYTIHDRTLRAARVGVTRAA
eukprot:TRINITY_DN14393_c0_g1_i1.p1 TRINITY_DN14393_c0_g1~~TRINITY_DN14393_c0_g1_i1.p1  ORF type:complete len:266 (+),score=52.45 TRINITY_DN14393_c0_g1_i1:94-798(+)